MLKRIKLFLLSTALSAIILANDCKALDALAWCGTWFGRGSVACTPVVKKSGTIVIPTQAETTTWLANISGNSGTISAASTTANNNFVYHLKSYSLRTKIKYVLTFSGNQLAAALCPIIYDYGTSVAANNNFVAGDYGELTGLGNAANTTRYLDLGFAPTSIGSSSQSIGVYVTATVPTGTTRYAIGTANASLAGLSGIGITSSGTLITAASGSGSQEATSNASWTAGFYLADRTSTSNLTLDQEGGQLAINTNIATITNATGNFFAFTLNDNGTPLSTSYFRKNIWLIIVGTGLTASDRTNLNTCVQQFKTDMGR